MGKVIRYRNKNSVFNIHYNEGDNTMCRALIQEIRRMDKSIESMPKCAERILEYFEIPDDRDTPIVYIMQKMGIIALRAKLEPRALSAYVAVNPRYKEKFGSNKIACVNREDSIGHQRFALAHELAHYLFDYNEYNCATYYNTYYADGTEHVNSVNADGIDIEYRANQFAAALLMPQKTFCNKYFSVLAETQSLPETIDTLSQFFKVSTTAVNVRIREVVKNQ